MKEEICKGLIKGKAATYGKTMAQVAGMIGIKERTLSNRLRSPQTFNLWELRNLFSGLHFSENERDQFLRAAIK